MPQRICGLFRILNPSTYTSWDCPFNMWVRKMLYLDIKHSMKVSWCLQLTFRLLKSYLDWLLHVVVILLYVGGLHMVDWGKEHEHDDPIKFHKGGSGVVKKFTFSSFCHFDIWMGQPYEFCHIGDTTKLIWQVIKNSWYISGPARRILTSFIYESFWVSNALDF